MIDWASLRQSLDDLARKQVFFIGGAPRSGTTWLQQLLNAHPEICCRGEGLFGATLAGPLDAMYAAHERAVATKNRDLFGHTGGYPLPAPEEAEAMLGTGVLLALRRQAPDALCRAIGEKTPENVFLFPRLQMLFPRAKLIAIARDPRDVLSSAWHFFHQAQTEQNETGQAKTGQDEAAAKLAFIDMALPSLDAGTRAIMALGNGHPATFQLVTYERLHRAPLPEATRLFRFLGVDDDAALVGRCVGQTAFPATTGQTGAFLRRGVVGDWRGTFTAAMGQRIVDRLGWSFGHFGWAA